MIENLKGIDFKGEFIPSEETLESIYSEVRRQVVSELSPDSMFLSEIVTVLSELDMADLSAVMINLLQGWFEKHSGTECCITSYDREMYDKLEVIRAIFKL